MQFKIQHKSQLELTLMDIKARRILIIHADDAIKEMLLLCLETIPNCRAIAVSSGIEGIKQAKEVDAILLDVDEAIPDLGWREIARCLQQDPLTNSIPIILLTATPRSDELIKFQLVNEVKAIAKTFDLMATAERVADLLNWN